MNTTKHEWIDWWKSESSMKEINWQKNMEIFVRTTEPILHYNANDVILDIGCGPGYLADFLKSRVKEIHCADIAERYLELCRQKFDGERHVFLHKLAENNYTNFSFFKDRKFSIIICLSVIQYYRKMEEVERLIEEVRRISTAGTRFLIADIPASEGKLSGVLGFLRTGVKERYLQESLKLLYRARAAGYYKTHSALGLLSFSMAKLNGLITKLQLNAEILSSQLTANAYRRHLLIRF